MSNEVRTNITFLEASMARLSAVYGAAMAGLETVETSELQKKRDSLIARSNPLIHQGNPVIIQDETQNPADGKIYSIGYASTPLIPVRLRSESEPLMLSVREELRWEGDSTRPDGFSLFVHSSPDIQQDRGRLLCSVRKGETCGLDNSHLRIVEEAMALQEMDRVISLMENYLKVKDTGLTRDLQEIFGARRSMAMEQKPELRLQRQQERLALMYRAIDVFKVSTKERLVENPGHGVHHACVRTKESLMVQLYPFFDCDLEARLVEHPSSNPGFNVVVSERGNPSSEITLYSVTETSVAKFNIEEGKGKIVLTGEDEVHELQKLSDLILKFEQVSQIVQV